MKILSLLNILISTVLRSNEANIDSGRVGSHSELEGGDANLCEVRKVPTAGLLCGHSPYPTWAWMPCTGQPNLGWQNKCEVRRAAQFRKRTPKWCEVDVHIRGWASSWYWSSSRETEPPLSWQSCNSSEQVEEGEVDIGTKRLFLNLNRILHGQVFFLDWCCRVYLFYIIILLTSYLCL